jgi:hypothetical protein
VYAAVFYGTMVFTEAQCGKKEDAVKLPRAGYCGAART